jgi:hypothetical protein
VRAPLAAIRQGLEFRNAAFACAGNGRMVVQNIKLILYCIEK